MEKVKTFIKKEIVLVIAAGCAVISMFFVPPSALYKDYIDVRVICLLFSLMAVVLGFQSCGLFSVLSQKLLRGKKPVWLLSFILVMLPFFTSMLVTNDVALLTFVPFTLLILETAKREKLMIPIVVLQTLAANLGSMATPVGNPQNLFLYNFYGMDSKAFFSVVLPLTGISFLLLFFACFLLKGESVQVEFSQKEKIKNSKFLLLNTFLFVLCLLSVFHVLSHFILTGIVLVCFLIFQRSLLMKVDYSLLLTFVFFFIFAGNLGNIPQISTFLQGLMEQHTLLCSALVSQVISNVPAAVLLSGFTSDWGNLLAGVNIGGLGTPVASLASLISLKLYSKYKNAKTGAYLLLFTVLNFLFLAVLFVFRFM